MRKKRIAMTANQIEVLDRAVQTAIIHKVVHKIAIQPNLRANLALALRARSGFARVSLKKASCYFCRTRGSVSVKTFPALRRSRVSPLRKWMGVLF